MKKKLMVLLLALLPTLALGATQWVTNANNSKSYSVPLGTACDAVEADVSASGSVKYHNVAVKAGVTVPFACKAVTVADPPPPPPPPPAAETIITITGSGFGTKAVVKPIVVANFSSGLAPSSYGQVTAWTFVQSMGWNATEGAGGGGVAKSTNDSGVWTLGVVSPVALNQYGNHVYLFQKVKRNFALHDPYVNWKIYRVFAGFGADYPGDGINHYWSPSNGGIGLEGFNPPFGVTESFPYSYYPNGRNGVTMADTQGPDNGWFTNEARWQTNSAATLTDGLYWLNVNNKEVASLPDIGDGGGYRYMLRNKDAATNDIKVAFVLQGVEGTEQQFKGSSKAYWGQYVYLDNSWARVVLADNLDWSQVVDYCPIPPITWSDTQITAPRMCAGGFIHVWNSAGEHVFAGVVQ